MIRLKSLISENQTIRMYHGGNRWLGDPRVNASSKGRYEGGVGIYFTTLYNTARKYAKGGKVVTAVEIDPNFKDIKRIYVPVDDMVNFINSVSKLKNKEYIIADVRNNAVRSNTEKISLDVLNNLIVNHESGAGQPGLEITKYFVRNGGDATLDKRSNEDWLIVFNPSIIKSHTVINPAKLKSKDFELPRLESLMYDDNKREIPLEKTFDINSKDIRL